MSGSKEFNSLYRKLNPSQKKAVDTVEGPVMVIAGPGTGKTTILTLRIANILRKTDTDADSILALTFTESGVYSMRKKLVEIIGSTGYKVNIHTFHSFANNVIKRNPDDFPRIIGSRHATDIELISILEEIFEKPEFDAIKPYGNPTYYLKPSLNAIRKLKMENISPRNFKEKISAEEEGFNRIEDLHHDKGRFAGQMKGKYKTLEKDIQKNKELLSVYEQYEAMLSEQGLYDYEDMLLEVIAALESNVDLRLRLQEKYQYILADEHQDANFAQNKILELLSSPPEQAGFHQFPNLFVVGDEKQAIFRFQGASLDNFLYFRRMFPEVELITLTDNYRSTQTILDSAHALISQAEGGEEVPRERLVAKREGGEEQTIKIYDFKNYSLERAFIARDIEERLKEGTSPSEIAVLYRDNKDAFSIADVLERTEVPFVIESSVDIFSDEDISKAVILFRAITDPTDDEMVLRLLHLDFLGIDPIDAHKVSLLRREKKTKTVALLKDQKTLAESSVESTEDILKFGKLFRGWVRLAQNRSAADVFEIVLRESGFLTHLLSLPESVQKVAKLEKLFAELREAGKSQKDFKLKDFINYLDTLENHNILISASEEAVLENAVRLMTAHRSKGLEFEVVYIIDAVDGHWGNRKQSELFSLPVKGFRRSESGDTTDDERRLFYVALTRAKREVVITYSRTTEDGKSQLRSQFVEEIEDRFRDEVDTIDIEKSFEGKRTFFEPKKARGPSVAEKEYLSERFVEQGLSVTALNNYLSCPWRFFFENLIRIPKAPNKFQGYGTSVHEALFFYFENVRKYGKSDIKEMLKVFERSLSRQTLSESDYQELLKKGRKALPGYIEKYGKNLSQNIFNEFDVAGVYLSMNESRQVLLKGKLDKVEIGDGGEVDVYDYKTAKPQSRNYILGKTKSSSGDYWRQLVFYKMLLNRLPASNWSMKMGVIDFVEPDDKGRYRRERFEVTNEDVALLEEEIKRVSEEILNLEFWNKKCGDTKCEYCRLRKMMKNS